MNKQKAATLSIFSNSALIIAKLTVGFLMGSISVISEGFHSAIDLLASFIAFFAIKKAGKAKDDDHNFGHAKYENLSGFVEALLILFAGLIIIYEAVQKLISRAPVESLGLGIIVMVSGSAINLIISRVLHHIARKENSIALKADAAHLLTDVYTSAGVTLGLVLIKITGLTVLDPIFAILVSILIIKTSIQLVKESSKDLLDTSLNNEELEKIKNVFSQHPEVKNYHKLRTRKSGNVREIDIHIKMDRDLRLEDVHVICHRIEAEIKAIFPESYVLLHPEPYMGNPD